MLRLFFSFLIFLALALPVRANDEALTDTSVLGHLEQTIAWQQDVVVLSPAQMNAREVVLRASLQKNAARTLQHAFAYARAYAAFADEETVDAGGVQMDKDDRARMAAAAAETKANIARATTGLAQINVQLRHANNKTRPGLQLQKARLEGLLRFSQVRQDMLNNANKLFANHGNDETEDLMGRITNLSRSVPGVDTKAPKPGGAKAAVLENKDSNAPSPVAALTNLTATTNAAPADAPATTTPTPGISGLISSIFSLTQKQQDVQELLNETRVLCETNMQTTEILRNQLRSTIARGNDLTKTDTASQTVDTIQSGVDSEIKNLQDTSAVLLPLVQMSTWLNTSLRNLEEWNGLLGDEMGNRLRQLGVKLAFLAVALSIPFALSELARRASTRYVSDARRHRQLRTIRRTLLTLAVLLILVLNFVSEFGAFATFAGFLTAGLAVALQNILLSMVAHFFFFGRYGVRSGDRVTVSGTTGEVLQIGITRFYLRELEMEDGELKPNGKIVAFPNSILFQPTAFSKHVNQN